MAAAPVFDPTQPVEAFSDVLPGELLPRFDPQKTVEAFSDTLPAELSHVPRIEPPADLSRVRSADDPIQLGADLKELPASYYDKSNLQADTTGLLGRTLKFIGDKLEPITPKETALPKVTAGDVQVGNWRALFGSNETDDRGQKEINTASVWPPPENIGLPAKIAAGVQRGLATVVGGAVPWVIAGPMIGAAGRLPLAARTISAAFAADMASQLPSQAKVFLDTVDKGDTQTAVEVAVGGTAGALLSALAIRHAIGPTKVPRFDSLGNPIMDPQTGDQAFDLRGIAQESPAVRALLTKKISTEYTPEQIKDVYGRVNRGEANPAEQELVRFINSALEQPGQAARKGVQITERMPLFENEFWRNYLGLKEGERTVTIAGEKPAQPGGPDAVNPVSESGGVQSEPARTLQIGQADEQAKPGDRVPSPAGQPPERPNAPAQAAQAPIAPSAEPRATAAAEQPLNPTRGPAPPPPVTPNAAADVIGEVESNASLMGRTQPGESFNKASADRAGKMRELAQKIQEGDILIDEDGVRRVVQQKAKDGTLFVYPEGGKINEAAEFHLEPGMKVERARQSPVAETPKSSTQLTVPATEAASFTQFAQSIPDAEVYHKADATGKEDYGIETAPHITVLYGLTQHEPSTVTPIISTKQPITVTLGKLSVFSSKDYDVLKVDVHGDDLRALNKEIAKLPNEQTHPEYTPHLTIAYLKKGEGKKYVGDKRFNGMKLTFPSVTFSPPSEIRAKTGVAEIPFSQPKPKEVIPVERQKEKEGQGNVLVPPAVAGGKTPVAPPAIRKGEVGGMLSAGEVVLTSSGRQTTPFPKLKTDTNRKATSTVKRVDAWLRDNAIAEARSRNDEFNARQFEAEDPAKMPPASKSAMEEYLFGQQPEVPAPLLKPITPTPAEMSPIGDKPAAPSEPLDTLGNPESFYATKSLMGAQMRRSPKLAEAMKFYAAKTIKRLNELATRRFAEMRERATADAKPPVSDDRQRLRDKQDKAIALAERLKLPEDVPISEVQVGAPTIADLRKVIFPDFEASIDAFITSQSDQSAPVAEPEPKPAAPPPPPNKPTEAPPVAPVEKKKPATTQAKDPWQMTRKEFEPLRQKVVTVPARIENGSHVAEHNETIGERDPRDKRKIGDTGYFYRSGNLPSSGFSRDYRENKTLEGVSVYNVPRPTSFAGFVENDWYYGKGKIVGFGSDGEPLIKPMGQWRKFADSSPNHYDLVDKAHRAHIEDALRQGKTVPPEVLADYPDLKNPALKSKSSLGPAAAQPMTQSAVESVVRDFFGGEIPANVRFVNDANVPRATVEMAPGQRGQITLNLAKLDSPELVRQTLLEELIHPLQNNPDAPQSVKDAFAVINKLVSDAEVQRQTAEGYNPNVSREEAENERARIISDDAEKANIFVRAWRAIVEAIKRLFGVKLNANESARAAARTIMREARKNEPTTRGGVRGAEPSPTPAEKAVLNSDAFKRNLDLADELGRIVPEEGETGVPTKVGNVEDMVLTRPGLNAAVREDSVDAAATALREAGLNIVRHADGLWDLADRVTNQDMAGNALVPILEREIQAARASNRPERIANLLNTVVVHLARDGNGAFSQTVKDQLYALAQSERSAFGRALGGLAMWGNVMANIAQSPALHLHRIYSKAVGGPEIERVLTKLLTAFRDFFSPEEIRRALNPLNLDETAARLVQFKESQTGGRVYQQVQRRLRGTPPKTQEQKDRRAVEDDAIESLIRQAADLGHIEPPKPKNQKLTADEQLALLSNPKVAAKVQQATETAVQNAEFNAGWRAEANAARGDDEALADIAERKALGEDPSSEMIEAGLNLPEFAHWRDIRDNFLDYSPTTLKVVRDVVKGRFRGAKYGVAEPKPEDVRIDFKKLAVEPDVEVQRVFDAQVVAVQGLMDKATPATAARLSAVFRQNIEDQLARHRKETVDKLFKEQATGKESPTAIETLKQKINAGLLRDQRLSDAEMAQRAADKSTLRDVLPSVSELVERIVTAPRYKMADIKTDVAAALVKELGLTDEAAANLSELVYRALDGTDAKPGPLREAARKALEQVQTALSPADRKILFKKHVMVVNDIRGRKPGRTLWELIERGARAGLFDPTTVLETMARAIGGFRVPTADEKARMKSWAEEEIRLRTPTQRQIDNEQGTPGEKLAKATRKAEAGTESDRLELIRKIQANWSRWSMPLGLRNFLDPTIKRNNAKAINEFVAANLLSKAGFFFRQGLDVGLVSMPLNAANRALAHVLERAQNDGGFTAETLKDLDAAAKEMVTARLASFKATLVAAGRTATGHTNRKVLDRMNHSIGVFERMRVKADELEAAGNLAGARALRVATILQIGYRVAMTWDTIQSVGLEWQEMRQQLSTDLRRAGKTHAQIATTLDDVFGSIKLDMAEAVAEANAIATEKGLTKSKSAIQADAWALIKAKAYDRMRTAAGTTTDYQAENDQYKELHSWNLPETGGVGGVIAETIKGIKKATEKAGIPTGGLFSFGNAMGIAANRMLTFSGGGLFGGFGFGSSEWYKGERNKKQRRLEALEGLAAIALVIALVAAGKLIIQTKYPKDKDEKEKFIADGHKLNTLRWVNEDGSWLEYPIQMAPFGFIASPLYMVGGVQRLLTDQASAQAKLDAEAASTGKIAGKAKAVDAGDVMGVLAQGVYGMLTGGRTASGAVQSFTDYGDFKLNKAVSGLASPYIPGLPAWQEAARAMGATMDTRTASVLELLVPTPWGGHQRVNSLGDPLVNPNAVSRLVQVMSGGIGWGDGSLPDSLPYRNIVQAGYSTPEINPNKGYDFNGTIRPMTGKELEAYAAARGEAFKQELSGVSVEGLPENEARKVVQAAYARANRTALASVGVTVPATASASGAGIGSSGAQMLAGAPVAARVLGVPRGTSRFGPARGNSTLRFARSPSKGLRLPSRRGSLRLGFRKGPTVRRRGTLRLPARSGLLRLRRPSPRLA